MNKMIMSGKNVIFFFAISIISLIFLPISDLQGQKKQNPYNLFIIQTMEQYKEMLSKNPDIELVDLEGVIENVNLDIRYATKNNFTDEIIYSKPKAFLTKNAASALKLVQDSLRYFHIGLKIYDAYRPYSASLKFFEVYPDTNFVANPRFGSRHNRGCAVDVSLIWLNSGEELEMPSEFDDFSEKAHPEFMEISKQAKANRQLLFDVMQHFGFTHYPTEWWHFDFKGWENFPLMDLTFEELEE